MADHADTPVAGLTPRQAAFVREYLVDRNGTQAAIRAGFSRASARTQAAQMLRIAKVREAADALVAASASERIAEHEELCAQLTAMVRSSVSHFLTGAGEVDEARFADPELAAGVEYFRSSTTTDAEGRTTRRVEFRLCDRIRAMERLAKLRGLDGPERHRHEIRPMILLTAEPTSMGAAP